MAVIEEAKEGEAAGWLSVGDADWRRPLPVQRHVYSKHCLSEEFLVNKKGVRSYTTTLFSHWWGTPVREFPKAEVASYEAKSNGFRSRPVSILISHEYRLIESTIRTDLRLKLPQHVTSGDFSALLSLSVKWRKHFPTGW